MNNHVCVAQIALILATLLPRAFAQDKTPRPNTIQLELGPHTRTWGQVIPRTNFEGAVSWRTNTYTEVQTGLGVHDPKSGLFRESSPDFVVLSDGYGIATNCQHQLIVSPRLDDPAGFLDAQLPNGGGRVRTTLLGLTLFSPTSGRALQVAAVRPGCVSEQTGPAEITFFDAFEGLRGSVRVRNERGGYHQDVLLLERLTPEQLTRLGFGDDLAGVRLECWSEFLFAPLPAVKSWRRQLPSGADVIEEEIDFGTARLGPGRAFVEPAEELGVPVRKRWYDNRYLIESVPYSDLLPVLTDFPVTKLAFGTGKKQPSGLASRIPQRRLLFTYTKGKRPPQPLGGGLPLTRSTGAFSHARAAGGATQLVLDYTMVNGTLTNFIARPDETIFVSGPAAVVGELVLSGGAVVKVTNSPNAGFTASNIVCRTGPYRPAVLTSWCDDSVGATILGSTGNPTNYLGGHYLSIPGWQNPSAYRYIRFLFAGIGISSAPSGLNLWHCQFVNCSKGVSFTDDGTIRLHNALFSGCDTAVAAYGNAIVGEHLTVDGGAVNTSAMDVVRLTNSILTGVTIAGDVLLDHSVTYSSGSGVFESVGAGKYYLASTSTDRAQGTTSVDPVLLSELRSQTTHPPFVYSSSPTVSSNQILAPIIPRDLGPAPDRGFHYPAIDFAFPYTSFSTCLVRIAPGTVLTCYRDTLNGGLTTLKSAQLLCNGSPTNYVRFVEGLTVQEQPNSNWSGLSMYSFLLASWDEGAGLPSAINCRFTEFCSLAQDTCHISYGGGNSRPLNFMDCEFHGGRIENILTALNFTNCLLDHVFSVVEPWGTTAPAMRNNLFLGGAFYFSRVFGGDDGLIQDNLFDGTALPILTNFVGGFNAFAGVASDLQYITNATDISLTQSPSYQKGPLGDYYQPNNSALIDRDTSTPASAVGLYHYTVSTNMVGGTQVAEGSGWLDVGLHYVAVDAYGNPIDSDGGGIGDFLEDSTGDGFCQTNTESDWRVGHQDDDYRHLVAPGYLRVEYRENPWGVDARDPWRTDNAQRPRFFWVVNSAKRAQKQLAYQILVASSESNLAGNNGDLWNSGKVYSDATIHVEYDSDDAVALQSGMRCWWKVRTWDPFTGVASSWSTNAFFQMGLLNTNDWSALWLTTATDPGPNVSPMYRKTFIQRTNDIKKATVYVSAKGVYELWLDGQRVGNNILAPEWTDYNVRIQYQTFDVTTNLMSANTDGTNHAIGGIVAEGWYSGRICKDDPYWNNPGSPNYTGYTNLVSGHGPKQLLVQLMIEKNDGSITNIVTDATWKCCTSGPIQKSSIYDGEIYDARKDASVAGWSTHRYTAESSYFTAAISTESPVRSELVPQPNDPIQIVEYLHPIDMWTNQGVRIFDMGQNMVGWCSVSVVNTGHLAGTTLTLRHSEMLRLDTNNRQVRGENVDENSLGTTVGSAAMQTDTYFLLQTNTVQQLEPHFTYHGFRFVEVAGPLDVVLTTNSIVGCVIRSAVPITGSFSCSHSYVNQAVTNALWTRKANVFGIETDCPQRNERFGWLGDSDEWAQGACFMVDMSAFYTKIIRDMRDEQVRWYPANSTYFGVYWPNNPWAGKGVADMCWMSGGVMRPWVLYQNYGDERLLREHYFSASNYVHFLTNFWPSYLFSPKEAFGQGNEDWVDGDDYNSQWLSWWTKGYASTPESVIADGHYAHVADLAAKMSQVMQLRAEAKGSNALATVYSNNYSAYKNIAANVRSQFTNPANGLVKYDSSGNITNIGNGAQGNYGLALHFQMVPENQRSNCMYRMVHDPDRGIANYNHHNTRPVGTANKLSSGMMSLGRSIRELSQNGYSAKAYEVLLDYEFPSWLYQITNGGSLYKVAGNYGATTSWERRDGWLSGSSGGTYGASSMNSFNHSWQGMDLAEWVYWTIGGIRPDEHGPSFMNTLIRPQAALPGGPLTNAWTSFNSIRGQIVSSWICTTNVSSTNLALTVTIPANTTASVYLPTASLSNITEGGTPATNAAGVIYFQTTNDTTIFQLGSGTYSFDITNIKF